MAKTWFTADTHFYHKNIIKYCSRPFKGELEMNRIIIANWNAKVAPDDTIYHLGDFIFGTKESANHLLNQLNGQKHLISGNHDNAGVKSLSQWRSVNFYKELKLSGRRVVLFHYAIQDWNGAFHGALMFHGHSHGTIPNIKNRFDVGVDCWGFAPVSLDDIDHAEGG